MPKTETPIIQVTTPQQLRDSLSKLEKDLSTLKKREREIHFNGIARIGVWQADHSDIGCLSTYFEGGVVLKVSGHSYHVGEFPQAFDYQFSSPDSSNIVTDFRYHLQDGEKQPTWQKDSTYKNAITLRQKIKKEEKDIFPEVRGILLWVNEPGKVSRRKGHPVIITN